MKNGNMGCLLSSNIFQAAALTVFPCVILGIDYGIGTIIAIAATLLITFLPFVAHPALLAFNIWAFIVALGQPIDVVSIIFFVIFGIYAIGYIIPTIIELIEQIIY